MRAVAQRARAVGLRADEVLPQKVARGVGAEDSHALLSVAGDHVVLDGVVGCADDGDAGTLVGDGHSASDIGTDEVALNCVASGAGHSRTEGAGVRAARDQGLWHRTRALTVQVAVLGVPGLGDGCGLRHGDVLHRDREVDRAAWRGNDCGVNRLGHHDHGRQVRDVHRSAGTVDDEIPVLIRARSRHRVRCTVAGVARHRGAKYTGVAQAGAQSLRHRARALTVEVAVGGIRQALDGHI